MKSVYLQSKDHVYICFFTTNTETYQFFSHYSCSDQNHGEPGGDQTGQQWIPGSSVCIKSWTPSLILTHARTHTNPPKHGLCCLTCRVSERTRHLSLLHSKPVKMVSGFHLHYTCTTPLIHVLWRCTSLLKGSLEKLIRLTGRAV